MYYFLSYIVLSLLCCSCSSKPSYSSQDKKRLEDNLMYAQMLYRDAAAEIPSNLFNHENQPICVLVDSLLANSIQRSCLELPPANIVNACISEILQKKTTLTSLLEKQIDSLYEPASTQASCFEYNDKIIVQIDSLSPLAGSVCKTAFASEQMKKLNLPIFLFPKFLGLEITTKNKTPYFYLIQSYPRGFSYSSLLLKTASIKNSHEKSAHLQTLKQSFALLGQAVAQMHTSTRSRTQTFPSDLKDSIKKLIESLSKRYLAHDQKLQQAVLYTSQFLTNLLFHFEKDQRIFTYSYTLGNPELKKFFLIRGEKNIVYTDVASCASSFDTTADCAPQGLISYDYCKITHDIDLIASRVLSAEEKKIVATSFDQSFIENGGKKPASMERIFFSILDLLDRLEKMHSQAGNSKVFHEKEIISLSLLEEELLQWTSILKKRSDEQ